MWWPRSRREPLRAVELVTVPGLKSSPSFSPDGDHVAFEWNGPSRIISTSTCSRSAPARLAADTDPRHDYNRSGRRRPLDRFLRSESLDALAKENPETAKSELRLIPSGGRSANCRDPAGETYWNQTFLAWCPDSALCGGDGFRGRGEARRLVRGFTRNRGEKAVDQSQPPVAATSTRGLADGRWLVFKRIIGFPARALPASPGKSLTARANPGASR